MEYTEPIIVRDLYDVTDIYAERGLSIEDRLSALTEALQNGKLNLTTQDGTDWLLNNLDVMGHPPFRAALISTVLNTTDGLGWLNENAPSFYRDWLRPWLLSDPLGAQWITSTHGRQWLDMESGEAVINEIINDPDWDESNLKTVIGSLLQQQQQQQIQPQQQQPQQQQQQIQPQQQQCAPSYGSYTLSEWESTPEISFQDSPGGLPADAKAGMDLMNRYLDLYLQEGLEWLGSENGQSILKKPLFRSIFVNKILSYPGIPDQKLPPAGWDWLIGVLNANEPMRGWFYWWMTLNPEEAFPGCLWLSSIQGSMFVKDTNGSKMLESVEEHYLKTQNTAWSESPAGKAYRAALGQTNYGAGTIVPWVKTSVEDWVTKFGIVHRASTMGKPSDAMGSIEISNVPYYVYKELPALSVMTHELHNNKLNLATASGFRWLIGIQGEQFVSAYLQLFGVFLNSLQGMGWLSSAYGYAWLNRERNRALLGDFIRASNEIMSDAGRAFLRNWSKTQAGKNFFSDTGVIEILRQKDLLDEINAPVRDEGLFIIPKPMNMDRTYESLILDGSREITVLNGALDTLGALEGSIKFLTEKGDSNLGDNGQLLLTVINNVKQTRGIVSNSVIQAAAKSYILEQTVAQLIMEQDAIIRQLVIVDNELKETKVLLEDKNKELEQLKNVAEAASSMVVDPVANAQLVQLKTLELELERKQKKLEEGREDVESRITRFNDKKKIYDGWEQMYNTAKEEKDALTNANMQLVKLRETDENAYMEKIEEKEKLLSLKEEEIRLNAIEITKKKRALLDEEQKRKEVSDKAEQFKIELEKKEKERLEYKEKLRKAMEETTETQQKAIAKVTDLEEKEREYRKRIDDQTKLRIEECEEEYSKLIEAKEKEKDQVLQENNELITQLDTEKNNYEVSLKSMEQQYKEKEKGMNEKVKKVEAEKEAMEEKAAELLKQLEEEKNKSGELKKELAEKKKALEEAAKTREEENRKIQSERINTAVEITKLKEENKKLDTINQELQLNNNILKQTSSNKCDTDKIMEQCRKECEGQKKLLIDEHKKVLEKKKKECDETLDNEKKRSQDDLKKKTGVIETLKQSHKENMDKKEEQLKEIVENLKKSNKKVEELQKNINSAEVEMALLKAKADITKAETENRSERLAELEKMLEEIAKEKPGEIEEKLKESLDESTIGRLEMEKGQLIGKNTELLSKNTKLREEKEAIAKKLETLEDEHTKKIQGELKKLNENHETLKKNMDQIKIFELDMTDDIKIVLRKIPKDPYERLLEKKPFSFLWYTKEVVTFLQNHIAHFLRAKNLLYYDFDSNEPKAFPGNQPLKNYILVHTKKISLVKDCLKQNATNQKPPTPSTTISGDHTGGGLSLLARIGGTGLMESIQFHGLSARANELTAHKQGSYTNATINFADASGEEHLSLSIRNIPTIMDELELIETYVLTLDDINSFDYINHKVGYIMRDSIPNAGTLSISLTPDERRPLIKDTFNVEYNITTAPPPGSQIRLNIQDTTRKGKVALYLTHYGANVYRLDMIIIYKD